MLSTYLGHVYVAGTYWYLSGHPGADGTSDGAARAALGRVIMTVTPSFATLLERFFTQRLMQQRQASVHTIASYRDTFRLLLQFAQSVCARRPRRWRSKTSMRRWSGFPR